jgi:hypothetical protein
VERGFLEKFTVMEDNMRNLRMTKLWSAIFFSITTCYAGLSGAHDIAATMDPNNNVASFTGYAQLTCFDEGGLPDYLEVNIKDLSPPVDNLLVNLQVIKGERAINISDQISGDADPSPTVILQGGGGVYLMLVNKTGPGARSFQISYHCKAANGAHTGTQVNKVFQFQ